MVLAKDWVFGKQRWYQTMFSKTRKVWRSVLTFGFWSLVWSTAYTHLKVYRRCQSCVCLSQHMYTVFTFYCTCILQGDPTRLSIVISLWQVSNSQKMAKPNHFWKWYIGRFWYFDVSKVPGEFFLPFKVLSKWWLGSILTQSYMEKRISCCLSVPVGVYFCLIQLCKWIGDMWEYLGV